MRVLVTGGAGFIGSHVADAMIAAGHDVAIVDDLSSGRRANVPASARLYESDIRSEPDLADVFARERPEAVAHYAAQVDVRRSTREPTFDADVNIVGSLRVIQAAAAVGTNKIVYSSSAAVFGEPERLPVDEAHPVVPISEYGISKAVVEHYLRVTGEPRGVRWTALRYSNVYGPRQDALGEAGVVAIFAGRMAAGEPCEIFGDGEQTRDFIYVGDCADAAVRALGAADGDALVVGSGIETSVNALHDAMARMSGHTAPALHRPERPGEIRRMVFDATRAKGALGWAPRTPLEEGLAQTMRSLASESG